MDGSLLQPILLAAALLGPVLGEASAAEWIVAAGANGRGTAAAPFGRIQEALDVAQPGDTVTVLPGTYSESLQTVRDGTPSAPIRLRSQDARGAVVVSVQGRVLRVDHAYFVVEGLVLDGRYGTADTVDVNSGANFLELRDVEVRHSSRDLIDMDRPRGVLIEGSLLHHALNAAAGRTDAHGVVAGAVRGLTIRDTEIHTFSGDGVQIDPTRSAAGWGEVTIERCRIWLGPLSGAENGFEEGVVPGENAIDTKANAAGVRATLTIRDTTAWGFRGGLVANMAAFNLKENVEVVVDGATVYDSEIAFRVRGPNDAKASGAWVTVKNAVVHSTATAIRYENNIERLRIWNVTIGANVSRAFLPAASGSRGLNVRNLLVLGGLPSEAPHASNRSVAASAFTDVRKHDYSLAAGSLAIDAGVNLPDVAIDRDGVTRPQGAGFDIGAYERPAPDKPSPASSRRRPRTRG